MKKFCVFVVLLVCMPTVLLSGCMPVAEETKPGASGSIVSQEERGMVILILIDMSGSYASLMADGGKAHELVFGVISKYLRDRVSSGTHDRIIVGQLSAKGKEAILYDGTPLELRQKFSSPSDFSAWLKQNSDSGGSRIHDGIREGVRYLMSQPGVSEGRTRSAVIVASDLDDNASDDSGGSGHKSVNYLLGTLDTYGKLGGNIAMLYVDPPLCENWRLNLKSLFRPGHWVVESRIVHKVPIPNFSDD